MRFFVGLHQPSDAHRVDAAFISVNRLRKRKSGFKVGDWIMDSGAFTVLNTHGYYPDSPEVYASEIRRWKNNGNLLAAVSQDYMCEAFMLAKTGMTIDQHQRMTVERYDAIVSAGTGGVYLMPVLQGYDPADYVRHIEMYGDRLSIGAWVGVGSVCKRNNNPESIAEVLHAIKSVRPDLLLHGFGVKTTALADVEVRDALHTADSMAWSYAARIMGRNGNDVREALAFVSKIKNQPRRAKQMSLFRMYTT